MFSSSTTPQTKYDLFISFRGEENFATHLYEALRHVKIHTFIDSKVIRGNQISSALLNSIIQESKISIVIFSKSYTSKWCLEELVKILECKQIVIPVFYGVDPSDVRNQSGIFAEAFARHEKLIKDTAVQRWRTALTEAANLSGFDSALIRPESLLIESIVKDILERLNYMPPSFNKDLVGLDSSIEEIESFLCNGSSVELCSVGIWGIGGIGKTTLADAVFCKISSKFDDSLFIRDVGGRLKTDMGFTNIQEKLVNTFSEDENLNTDTSHVGLTITTKSLCRNKFLVAFDNVTSSELILSLIGSIRKHGSRIRIIITARDKQVLKECRVDMIYKVEELSNDAAIKLFSRHAFKRDHPPDAYTELSNKAVIYAKGVPLSLQLLGSSLFGRTKQKWERVLNELERSCHTGKRLFDDESLHLELPDKVSTYIPSAFKGLSSSQHGKRKED